MLFELDYQSVLDITLNVGLITTTMKFKIDDRARRDGDDSFNFSDGSIVYDDTFIDFLKGSDAQLLLPCCSQLLKKQIFAYIETLLKD